jgi:hypothetical protein
MSLSQRVLSGQSCSTSAPAQPLPGRRAARCSSTGPEGSNADLRQHRLPLRTQWIGTGCQLRSPHPQQQQLASRGNGNGPAVMQGLGSTLPRGNPAEADAALGGEPYDVTEFVAETLLPTRSGKFRLRGYRHTVRGCCDCLHASETCQDAGFPLDSALLPVCHWPGGLSVLFCLCSARL